MESSFIFFKHQRNDLNNHYMVHSECDQLPTAYAYKSKTSAIKAKTELNIQANRDYQKLKEQGIAPVLTWKEPRK